MKELTEADKALMKLWETFPVGTDVIVTKEDGEKVETETRSKPRVLDSGEMVMMVDGYLGCCPLHRICLKPSVAF